MLADERAVVEEIQQFLMSIILWRDPVFAVQRALEEPVRAG